MDIDGRAIGGDAAPYVIAEAGVNHNGSLERAEEMVRVAAGSGADAVKFQTFRPEALVTADEDKVDYQVARTDADEPQRAMLERLALTPDAFESLAETCAEEGITFLSTPFDRESADLLVEVGVPAIKIGSGDLTNRPLLEHVADLDRPLVVSTGMATMDEVHDAVGWIRDVDPDCPLALLHCTSAYPADVPDANLRAMGALRGAFDVPVGYSDHTMDPEMPGLAVAAGASIVEKHFTLDRRLEGPDHEASLEPDELDRAVSLVRTAATALGSAEKRPTKAEADMRERARRSLHAARDLSAGTALTADDVVVARPADGLSPAALDGVVGRVVAESVTAGTPLVADHFADPPEVRRE